MKEEMNPPSVSEQIELVTKNIALIQSTTFEMINRLITFMNEDPVIRTNLEKIPSQIRSNAANLVASAFVGSVTQSYFEGVDRYKLSMEVGIVVSHHVNNFLQAEAQRLADENKRKQQERN